MSLLHPTAPTATRAIDVIAQVVLVIADVVIILFLYTYLALGGSIFVYTAWFFAVTTVIGTILSAHKNRWSIFFLLLPIIIFGLYAIGFFYTVVIE